MKKYLEVPTILLSAFLIRILITGASVGDSIALAALAGLFGFYYYYENKKEKPINEAVKEELAQVKRTVVDIDNSLKAFRVATSSKNQTNTPIRF